MRQEKIDNRKYPMLQYILEHYGDGASISSVPESSIYFDDSSKSFKQKVAQATTPAAVSTSPSTANSRPSSEPKQTKL